MLLFPVSLLGYSRPHLEIKWCLVLVLPVLLTKKFSFEESHHHRYQTKFYYLNAISQKYPYYKTNNVHLVVNIFFHLEL